MINLDTNIIVRYFLHDDPVQTAAAIQLIESLTSEAPGFLSIVVIVEVAWVLEASYRLRKKEIAEALGRLLQSKELIIEQAELVSQALHTYLSSRADFADCLIERTGRAWGCRHTVTFDRKAVSAGMRLLV